MKKMKIKIPNCLDKSCRLKDGTFIIKDTKIRHMKPDDMDIILDNYEILYRSPIYGIQDGYHVQARGMYLRNCNKIILDPHFDLGDTLIHETAHAFYGRFGLYEGNIYNWTEPMMKNPEFKKVAQKYIVKTLPDYLYWDVKDLPKVYSIDISYEGEAEY